MTKTHIIEIESVWFLAFAVIIGFLLAFYTRPTLGQSKKFSLPVVVPVIPTPVLQVIKPQLFSQISPDGTKILNMTIITNKNQTKTYTFFSTNADNTNRVQIYSVNYGTDTMSIPFNTWSPDDKYVFISHLSSTGEEVLVFKADGTSITPTDNFFNATQIFSSKITDNIYMETIGWASPTLLIINSKKTDGTKSTSYWLEIPSEAVIPLASQF